MGQQLPFDEASENLNRVGGITLSDKQIERICHQYGEELETTLNEDEMTPTDASLHYAMMDGSMGLIREEGWKEIKLGRVFAGQELIQVKERGWIRASDYVVHLGGHEAFLEKFEKRISHKTNLVAIADGARWIWDFWTENYPNAIQILDYYHAIEKIGNWAKVAIRDDKLAQEWIKLQETHLLNDEVNETILDIRAIDCKADNNKMKQQLLTYLENNKHRMKYKTYQEKELLIGSGPIEAANRQIVQARLKKSGQRWTPKGLQQVANLRVAHHSNRWELVKNAIKKAA